MLQDVAGFVQDFAERHRHELEEGIQSCTLLGRQRGQQTILLRFGGTRHKSLHRGLFQGSPYTIGQLAALCTVSNRTGSMFGIAQSPCTVGHDECLQAAR